MNAPFRDLLASSGKCTVAFTFYFRFEILDEIPFRSLIEIVSHLCLNSELQKPFTGHMPPVR
jgi:hypothetical protein